MTCIRHQSCLYIIYLNTTQKCTGLVVVGRELCQLGDCPQSQRYMQKQHLTCPQKLERQKLLGASSSHIVSCKGHQYQREKDEIVARTPLLTPMS